MPTREMPRRFLPCGVPQFGQVHARVPGRVWKRSPQTVHRTKLHVPAHTMQR